MKSIIKITPDEIKKTLLFLRFINLVDQLDFKHPLLDLDEYLHPEEIDVLNEFMDTESNFQYQLFFEEFNKLLSGRFHLLIAGYSDLIEKYCNPDSNILVQMENQITVKAEQVCEFSSFQMWVNKASSWIGSYSGSEKIVCIDASGNTLTCGGDFMHANENSHFPIKAYRLIRNTDEKIVKSISNN